MLKENLARVRAKIEEVCRRMGRDPREITLVCVTKGIDIEEIKEIISLGITDIGENRVQEALKKFEVLPIKDYGLRKLKWHMVGHLQRNKARHAVRFFDLIHSVDSRELAQEINKQAQKINKIQEILVEVNVSGEKTKFGIEPEKVSSLVREVIEFKNLNLKGLMTIAPVVDNAEKARPYFKLLRELKDKIYQLRITDYELPVLSMGMSQDFTIAIEEGATMVRIGTAIFKPPNFH